MSVAGPRDVIASLRKQRDGWIIRRSGLFDGPWYLRRYPDVAAAGLDPLVHYLDCGHAEGRFPNPIFDSRWYLERYTSGRVINPLVDYIREGAAAGRWPNRWFDPAFYGPRHGVGPRDVLRHYLDCGPLAGDTIAESPIAQEAEHAPDFGGHGSPLGWFLHDVRMVGAVDLCTSYYVRGWAYRKWGPAMVVTILVNGVAQGDVTPWIARPDVERVKGVTALGFFFAFPRRVSHGDVVAFADEFGDVMRGCTVAYEIPPLGASREHYPCRAAIAAAFLHGCGLEIGAFTQPTDLPHDRDVVFFDRFSTAELRHFYDPDCGRPMMEPTYVGEAETLDGVPPAAFDFIIANHVLEHLLDPIGFLERIAACLIDRGRAMIAVPDKRFCFDVERTMTSFAHLAEDHALGGAQSQTEHFLDYARVVGLEGEAAQAFVRTIDRATIHFHYHVWDAEGFVAFINQAIESFRLPLTLIYSEANTYDIIVVVEKRAV